MRKKLLFKIIDLFWKNQFKMKIIAFKVWNIHTEKQLDVKSLIDKQWNERKNTTQINKKKCTIEKRINKIKEKFQMKQ